MTKYLLLISFLLISSCSKQNIELQGKTLNLMVKDNIRSADPAVIYDVVSTEPMSQVYETLLQYDYFKKKKTLQPSLAEEMPEVSKDRLTYVFKIKKGVRFQDDPCFENGKGRELKAKDFIYAWKRHAITRVHSEGLWIFEKKIVGYDDFLAKFKDSQSEYEIMDAEIEGMKAVDDYTIQLKTLKPYPQLKYIMAMNFTAPVAIEAVKTYGQDFANHMVGTGPYKVVKWEPQNEIILTKNENYREERFPKMDDIDPEYQQEARSSIGKKLPLANNIVIKVIKETQPRWLQMVSKKLDHIEIPKDNVNEAFEEKNPTVLKKQWLDQGFKVSRDEGVVYWYLFFNMDDAFVGKQKLLRQAISHAIDRKKWLKLFRNDRGIVAAELAPTSVEDRCGTKELKYDYDLEKAKALLVKAGFPQGKGAPRLKLDMRGANAENRQIGEFVARSLGEIGLEIEIILNTFPAFLEKRSKKNLQVSYGGWVMDYPDIENSFQMLYGPNEAPGANESNFKNSKLDDIYKKMALMESGPDRKKLVCQAEDIVQEEVPVIYGFYESLYRMVRPGIKNFHTYEMMWNKYKYIDVVENGKN